MYMYKDIWQVIIKSIVLLLGQLSCSWTLCVRFCCNLSCPNTCMKVTLPMLYTSGNVFGLFSPMFLSFLTSTFHCKLSALMAADSYPQRGVWIFCARNLPRNDDPFLWLDLYMTLDDSHLLCYYIALYNVVHFLFNWWVYSVTVCMYTCIYV